MMKYIMDAERKSFRGIRTYNKGLAVSKGEIDISTLSIFNGCAGDSSVSGFRNKRSDGSNSRIQSQE